ncbi:MAG: hypothetical protein ACK5MD_06710 [Flavobacteriales bacterium]
MNYLVVFIILIAITIFITGYFVSKSTVYDCSFFGKIVDIRYGTRDISSAVIKFNGTNKFNKSISFKVPANSRNELQKGDSIFKPMFSNKAYLYRKEGVNYTLSLILEVK